ncbi:MAG: oligosaccharide flippase family protein [Candidatus Omnitrophota bacterium]
MVKRSISRVFVIIASIALLQIVGTIILARNFTKPEMGFYRLVLTMIEYGSLLAIVGMDHSIVRFFSSAESQFSQYNWKKFLGFFPFSLILISFAFILLMSVAYKLNLQISILIFTSIILTGFAGILSSFLRAQKKYTLSAFLGRLNFLIFFAAVLLLVVLKSLSVTKTILAYLISLLIALSILKTYVFNKIPSGVHNLPSSIFRNRSYYFGMGLAFITIIQAGNFFIAKMLSLKDLGVYAVLFGIMRLFEFTQDSIYYVLVPALNAKKHIPAKNIFLSLLLIGIVIGSFYLAFGGMIVHWLFSGRYDEGIPLIPFFIIIGIIKTLLILPTSIIGGKSSEQTLQSQCYLFILTALVNIVLTIVFIRQWQLKGVLLANLVSWSLLLLFTTLGTKKYWGSQTAENNLQKDAFFYGKG